MVVESGIRVIRVVTPPRKNILFFLRGLSEMITPWFFRRAIQKYGCPPYDLIVTYSPSLQLAKMSADLKKKWGARYILNVQDIFPQNAIDLGILKNTALIRFYEKIEKAAYQAADLITSHTENSKRFLIEKKSVPKSKIRLVQNWIDVARYHKAKRKGKYRYKLRINQTIVILFAGIMGPAQGLDLILEAAYQLRTSKNICFFLVGDGSARKDLEWKAAALRLRNVIFHDFIAVSEYPELVKDADIGLISLSKSNKTPVVPGKVLGFMAAGIPVLAFLNRESDGHALIARAKCGISAPATVSAKEAADLIRRFCVKDSTFSTLGKNGYRYVKAHHDCRSCLDAYVAMVMKVAAPDLGRKKTP